MTMNNEVFVISKSYLKLFTSNLVDSMTVLAGFWFHSPTRWFVQLFLLRYIPIVAQSLKVNFKFLSSSSSFCSRQRCRGCHLKGQSNTILRRWLPAWSTRREGHWAAFTWSVYHMTDLSWPTVFNSSNNT